MPRGSERWFVLLVVAAACVPYLSTIGDYFIQDDFGVVQLLTSRGWRTFPRWFTMPWMENIWGAAPDEIRPFVAFSYQLTGKWIAERPELHHALNIALHAGTAILVMAIGRAAAGLSAPAAALAGVIFAVLPSQVESAAWITGRVDSMPAFFYLATFLAYLRWRQSGRRTLYGWALALFFVTLFSKQTAITVPATLAAYDLLMLDRKRRGSLLSCLTAWLPFIIMTAGYLALRRILVGHAVRGGVHSWDAINTFLDIVQRHLLRVTVGHLAPLSDWEVAALIVLGALVVVTTVMRPELWRRFLFFCVVWWIIGVAPILVATYESPRHVYLASAGWAFLLALVADALFQRARRSSFNLLIATAAAAIVAVYVGRLHATLGEWHALARISKAAVERVREEARAAPDGTLVLMSVPTKSWEWGVPFVLKPPYQPEDLTKRVRLLTPWRLYCCGPELWADYSRSQIRAWMDSPARPPVIALHFAPGTGMVSRVTDAENPELRALLPVFLQTDTPQALDLALAGLLERTALRK